MTNLLRILQSDLWCAVANVLLVPLTVFGFSSFHYLGFVCLLLAFTSRSGTSRNLPLLLLQCK